jgi:peptide-methionine (S)-S-oxide reductase
MSLGSMLGIGAWKQRMPREQDLLPGRDQPLPLHNVHHVHGRPLRGEAAQGFGGLETVDVGLGCFWGAERKFWQLAGVFTTAVGYAGGGTPNPTYEEVCSGRTGHTEVVRVVYDPAHVDFATVLKTFWESHDPTQGMRQGNDVGTQYRSVIHCHTQAQYAAALASREAYQRSLDASGWSGITTEIVYPAPAFFYAEDYHQQYLSKNPAGYCGIGGTGVSCPI